MATLMRTYDGHSDSILCIAEQATSNLIATGSEVFNLESRCQCAFMTYYVYNFYFILYVCVSGWNCENLG
jgi:hypothetical protein